MSFGYDDKKDAVPVARDVRTKQLIYVYPENYETQEIDGNDVKIKKILESIKDKETLNEFKALLKNVETKKTGEKSINHKGELELLPNLSLDGESDRLCIYVFGPNGSGKSYLASSITNQYKKLFPKNEVYLFSLKDEDKKLDDLGVERIDIEGLINDGADIDYKDFADSLCIFDDVDGCEKRISNRIQKLIYSLLAHGRSSNCSILTTAHIGADNHNTKSQLNESHMIVLFPQGNRKQNEYIMKTYLGIGNKSIKKLLKIPCRWIAFSKKLPMFYITSNGKGEMLSELDD